MAFLALFWLTRSIAIQREELRDTKIALEKANVAQQQQAITGEKQSFEGTFFSLLDQHNKVLESLSSVQRNGSSSFIDIMYADTLAIAVSDISMASIRFKKYDEMAGHYFRILYQLLKLIAMKAPGTTLDSNFSGDTIIAKPPSDSEKIYSNIVRSFLSSRLTQLLAINCYCANNGSTYWKYKCLVERYALLEHMPFEVFGRIHPALIAAIDCYELSAFGKSEFVPPRPDLGVAG